MTGVDGPGGGAAGRLPRALRSLERRMGADREGRTLWIWVVPAVTIVVTFAILAFLGIQSGVDLTLTLPMALTLSVFLGALSAIYLTAASADERDREDDGPDDGRGPRPDPAPPQRPPDSEAARTVTLPVAPEAPQRPRTPVASGEGTARR